MDTAGPPPAGIAEVEAIFARILNISVGLAFVAVTILLVWAGIKFITSGGDSKQISASWQIINWALLGIVFLIFAWLIILLIESVTGVNLRVFDLCFPGSNCR